MRLPKTGPAVRPWVRPQALDPAAQRNVGSVPLPLTKSFGPATDWRLDRIGGDFYRRTIRVGRNRVGGTWVRSAGRTERETDLDCWGNGAVGTGRGSRLCDGHP